MTGIPMRLLAGGLLAILSLTAAAADLPGASDYPELPRVDGTEIVGYDFREYDTGRFATGIADNSRAETVHPEGARTRIIYRGRAGQTSLQMIRNYERAFEDFGRFEEHFRCSSRKECRAYFAGSTVWSQDNRIPTVFLHPNSLYGSSAYRDCRYVYGTVDRDGTRYHVSVFSADMEKGQPDLAGRPLTHLEVLEAAEFEAELVFVDAAKIARTIDRQGAIALYGIQFDLDKADLAASSQDTVAEIARLLDDQPELELFIVGHSDDQGSYDYNVGLASRRAAAVVESLVAQHGIDRERLSAVGVGPVAPAASNRTEQGRALNRRVEIVRR